ncbi:leucine rich repeat domain containing protein [Rhodotorula toruloides]|uniref:Leucine rich repeat domain containing protein n=1 Tax=Rhodotorula toruloides TaxID=5286 RepID=A0A511KPT0_RHOTO|nr:leucine rich repeat domain containing protein [Rhodotorula toruloides]
MSAPRTPQRARNVLSDSPSNTPMRSPARGAASSAVVRTKGSGPTASPQIKAALAALRSKRQATSSSNIASTSSPQPSNEAIIPTMCTTRKTQDASRAEQTKEESWAEQTDLSIEWAVKGEGKLIEDAKRTGRLNFASRSLSAVPTSVYSALLPRSSAYHPSNRQPSHFRRAPAVDFTITRAEDEGRGPAKWFEQEELRSLNLSNNEIARLSEEIGGFEELEFLDLHGNLLSCLTASIGYLENLTSLSVALNGLSTFPLPLLNLRNLRNLSLAFNKISTLWPVHWRDALDKALQPPEASPSATPDSAEKKATPLSADFPKPSRAPFPRLTSLSLSGNPLDHSTFLEDDFELPPRLITLELASCGLTDSALPPAVFGCLTDLKEFDLSRNELSDELFSPSLFPDDSDSRLFPSLESLDLSLCPVDSLETIEDFLTRRVRRPINYVGVPKVVENLVKNEERKKGCWRIGVPADLPEGEKDGHEVRVLVRECMLRLEQGRRRAKFSPTETSLARERERVEKETPQAQNIATKPTPRPRARSPSPSPSPPSTPLHSVSAALTAAPAPATPSTPSRRRPVTLEAWEVEAAAGLSTPASRRKAAALAAKEKEERLKREREEQEQRARQKLEEARAKEEEEERRVREKQDAEKMVRKMVEVRLDGPIGAGEAGKEEEVEMPEGSPPPYSPSPALPSAAPALPSVEHEQVEADATDEAVALVASVYAPSQGKTTVTLASRSLPSLPSPISGSPPASLRSATHVDLSRNLLTTVPLHSLGTWGWNKSLRVLNLSCNRIAALELLTTPLDQSTTFFPTLDTLDLSSNYLPSTVASRFANSNASSEPLLSTVAALAPSLSTLSLRQNRLTSLNGISVFFLPASPGARGLKTLDLGENKIVDLGELCEVAERVEREGKIRWRCEELDLSMNEFKQLPPTLGLLPHTLVIHLQGNLFRFPRREVYENAGARQVLPWLRERLGR